MAVLEIMMAVHFLPEAVVVVLLLPVPHRRIALKQQEQVEMVQRHPFLAVR
jgi:hypothetical protein